ncbi:MAG: NAD-dependent epimerase/dehydratase family protein [Chitinivibrionales bacterium]|nr:NAD-dependent epimerase/dehydratase family protein [Chitinivibrionales bacterium]
MNILITGGAGFIGANLVEHLCKRDDIQQIILFDNLVKCSIGYIKSITGLSFDDSCVGKDQGIFRYGHTVNIKIITADIRDIDALINASCNIDAIIHLAAYTEVVKSVKNPLESYSINIDGTINVLEAARVNSIKRLVLASSNAAVGEKPAAIDERALPRPLSPYGAAKLCGEALCSAYANCYGIATTCLRFANAYGKYSDHKTSVVAKMMKELLKGDDLLIYGDGSQTRDFINAYDIARAIWLSLKRDKGFEIFQVASGKETSITELVDILRRVTGKDATVGHVAPRTGEIKRNYSAIAKIKEQLGFEPEIELENGIAVLYEYFKEKYSPQA